ncbi:MAG: hypothetical protein D6780_03675 [Candidatus Dadabacteria bacterium]|nr:MAG: hypothetical protein D6780_03675 [Candidatus Dadabacteria bacterium]
MNTVFKLYYHLWSLSFLASVFALKELLKKGRILKLVSTGVFTFISLILVTAGGINAFIFSSLGKLPPALNGLAYLREEDPELFSLIQWANKEVKGSPVVLEAYGPPYQKFARISVHTGWRTVLGWRHVAHLRGSAFYQTKQRMEDIKEIYQTADINRAKMLLKKYQVRFITAGRLEEKTYGREGIEKFLLYPRDFPLIFKKDKLKVFAVNY